MKIINKNDTLSWLARHKLLDNEGNITYLEFLKPLQFKTPKDSGIKSSLSKKVCTYFESQEESLLWINEFDIWSSCEDWALFYGYRKSLGENSELYEKPGHIFSNASLEIVRPLISMSLYFYWGAVIVSTSKNVLFELSHDEFIDVYVKDIETYSLIRSDLEKYMKLST